MIKSFPAAAFLLLAAGPAGATTVPVISGKYFISAVSVCQPQIQVTYTSGTVSGISVPFAGSMLNTAAVGDFNASTGKVSLSGAANTGSVLLFSDNVGHNAGTPFAGGPVKVKYAWSNTDTSVTINGVVFQPVYGHEKNGVVESFMLEGIDSGGCSVTISATK